MYLFDLRLHKSLGSGGSSGGILEGLISHQSTIFPIANNVVKKLFT